jgi:hypothetical protein
VFHMTRILQTCTGTSTAFDQFKAAGALATGQASQTMAARFGCPENKVSFPFTPSLFQTDPKTFPRTRSAAQDGRSFTHTPPRT